jgi:hypothetical protein
LTSNSHIKHDDVVWLGKLWVVPAAIIRTVTVFVVAVLFIWLEISFGVFHTILLDYQFLLGRF